MYPILLAVHSAIRWLALIGLLYALYRAYRGWYTNALFTPYDIRARQIITTIAHIQLVLGILLYIISPIAHYFRQHPKIAIHIREIRFFGLEHSTMMLLAIVLITIGSGKVKREPIAIEKFKIMAIWFSVALLIILASVPWSFSPLVNRPNLRPF